MSNLLRPWKTDPPDYSFKDWEWMVFDLDFNKLISKRVSEVLAEAIEDDGAYASLTDYSEDGPLTIIFGWPFGDGFLCTTLRELMIDYIGDYRPGGEDSGNPPEGDDADKVAAQIAALRQLADDMEKLAGLA